MGTSSVIWRQWTSNDVNWRHLSSIDVRHETSFVIFCRQLTSIFVNWCLLTWRFSHDVLRRFSTLLSIFDDFQIFKNFEKNFDDFQIFKNFEKNFDDFRRKWTINDYGVIFKTSIDVKRRKLTSNGVKWRQIMSNDVN